MNFSSVKAIATPDGNVKKVQRGDMILWETSTELLSGMFVNIIYRNKQKASSTATNATHSFTVTLHGIPMEHVQSFGVRSYSYASASALRESVGTYTAELLDTDYTGNHVEKTVTFTMRDASYTYPSFAGFLTYTDLDGSTKTLTTTRVRSVGESATASA
mgnify:CR=1 FL=1